MAGSWGTQADGRHDYRAGGGAEAAGWRGSLELKLQQGEGRGFYGVLTAATLGGVALCFVPIDPVRQLLWAAVVNGVVAVPIMAVMLVLARRPAVMGEHTIGRGLAVLGWTTAGIMAVVVAATFATA